MVLPNELTVLVLGCLEKPDLKNARLVSKTWSHYAAEPLFDKLYVSPREEDIRVFKLITQHPQLRRCVRELEYDTTRFSPDLSDADYFCRLVNCTPVDGEIAGCAINPSCFQEMYDARPKGSDPQIDEYLKRISPYRGRSDVSLAYEQCKHYDFIVEGERKWQECAAYQQMCTNSGDFLRILVSGLRNLDRLESVNVCQEWRFHTSCWFYIHQSHCFDSPIGRTWDMFYAQPAPCPKDISLRGGFDEFWTLTAALAFAQRRIRQFEICSIPSGPFKVYSIPAVVFDTVDHATQEMINCSVDAYNGMQDLTLQLAQSSKEVEDRSKLKKLSGLQSLLKSMTGLKKLNICFSQADGYDCYFSHEQVLPSDGRWMGLISHQISGMNTPAKDLVQLLTMRMPNLQLLHLSEIELVDGRWEGVIEGMKRSMHLGFFSCEACFGPWGVGCQDFTAVYFEVGSDSDVGQYVLCGGRHPCLLPDEPDEASKKYLSAPWL